MQQYDPQYWENARCARDKLANEYLEHPDVSLVDIGYPPEKTEENNELVVLRVHVTEHWFKLPVAERVAFPGEVDGFQVVIIRGDYRLDDKG
jgi:hypothetical protein